MAKMTEEHKRALAKGRAQARAVRNYLEALEEEASRSRRLDREDLEDRIRKVQERIDAEDNPAKRVELIQKRLDYEEQLVDIEDAPDVDALEKGFVDAAKEYSERKGITYTAWREAGVPAAVLRDAGIPRTRRPS